MSPTDPQAISELVDRSARTLLMVTPQLPNYAAISRVVNQMQPAISRGYFFPDEDERIRDLFGRYLSTRAALQSIIDDLRSHALAELKRPVSRETDVFLVAFCTACILVRTGRFLVDTFRREPVVWRKLDEAEPRFGIPAKQFTRVYQSLTSRFNQMTFFRGIEQFHKFQASVLAARESEPLQEVVSLLREELPHIGLEDDSQASSLWNYRWHSFRRRHHSALKKFTFGVFQLSGSLIAEIRLRGKRKRVTPGVGRKVARLLKPGDVIITRHDDAASNLFLPGFWPHAALYLGTLDQRMQLDQGLAESQCQDPQCVLEARKDGVRFRQLADTLAVDACVVLRPKLADSELAIAIARAMTHQGKPYDFEFDFRRSDKLVCTEVVYRAFQGIGSIEFELRQRAGRMCLSAEDILDRSIDSDQFEVVLVYGSRRNRFVSGSAAIDELIASYRARPA